MRTSTLDAARRGYGGSVRATIQSVDDSSKMQTVTVRTMHGQLIDKVERPQMYGFNSVPMAEDGDGKAAEGVVNHIGGNGSHPVLMGEGDRRTRPTNWEAGASGVYHYKGAALKLDTSGATYDAGPENKPHTTKVNNTTVVVSDGSVEVKINGTTFTVTDGKIVAKVGGTAMVVNGSGVYLGADPADGGRFELLKTVSSTATNSFAKI